MEGAPPPDKQPNDAGTDAQSFEVDLLATPPRVVGACQGIHVALPGIFERMPVASLCADY